MTEQATKEAPGRHEPRSVAEWISLAISLTIVLGLLAMVIFKRQTAGNKPAVIETQLDKNSVRMEGGKYYVKVLVTNKGELTAEGLKIEVERADEEPASSETKDFQLLYLDGKESSHGIVVLDSDPRVTPYVVSVVSFLEP